MPIGEDRLDRFQRDAAGTPEGRALVLGAPGTGKSTVLISRLAKLLEGGAAPGDVALLTASDRKAREMQDLAAGLHETHEGSGEVFAGSIAQYANRLLRGGGAASLGIPDRYSIWEPHCAEQAFRDTVLQTIDPSEVSEGEIGAILLWHRRNQSRDPGEPAIPPGNHTWDRVALHYTREKEMRVVLDLDDLVPTAHMALMRDDGLRQPDLLHAPRHILVDDGHLLTPAGYRFVASLTGNVFVAADPNGGTDVTLGAGGLLAAMRRDWGHVPMHGLTVNHLHSRRLAAVASSLTDRGLDGLQKCKHFSVRPGGTTPHLVQVSDIDAIPSTILNGVQQLLSEGERTEDMAVICGDPSLVHQLSTQLEAGGITCAVPANSLVRGRDTRLLNLLACVLNPRDLVAFCRTVLTGSETGQPSGMGMVSRVLAGETREPQADVFDAAERSLETFAPGSPVHRSLAAMVEARRQLERMLDDPAATPEDLLQRAWALLPTSPGDETPDGRETGTTQMPRTGTALPRGNGETLRQHLVRYLDSMNPGLYPEPPAPVQGLTLTTVREAEGRYWKTAWVLDHPVTPADGLGNSEDIAAERDRLFYLAVTRATHRLEYFYSAGGAFPSVGNSRHVQALLSVLEEEVTTPPAGRSDVKKEETRREPPSQEPQPPRTAGHRRDPTSAPLPCRTPARDT